MRAIKQISKRLLSCFLAVLMFTSILPASAVAKEVGSSGAGFVDLKVYPMMGGYGK